MTVYSVGEWWRKKVAQACHRGLIFAQTKLIFFCYWIRESKSAAPRTQSQIMILCGFLYAFALYYNSRTAAFLCVCRNFEVVRIAMLYLYSLIHIDEIHS
jgi:hypothetical protein